MSGRRSWKTSSSAAFALALVCLFLWPDTSAAADNAVKDEAAAISLVAMGKAKAGNYALCADLYVQAYRIDPSFLGYLYSAARCQQKAGKLDDSERNYRVYLKRAPPDDELVARARQHLNEIMAARKEALSGADKAGQPVFDTPEKRSLVTRRPSSDPAVEKTPMVPTAEAVEKKAVEPGPPVAGWKGPMAWSGLIGGSLLALSGTGLLVVGQMKQSTLEDDLATSGGGKIVTMSRQQALDREAENFSTMRSGAVLAGVGVIAAAAGYWWLDSTRAGGVFGWNVSRRGVAVRVSWR